MVISGAHSLFFSILISPILLKGCIAKLILHNRLLSGLGAYSSYPITNLSSPHRRTPSVEDAATRGGHLFSPSVSYFFLTCFNVQMLSMFLTRSEREERARLSKHSFSPIIHPSVSNPLSKDIIYCLDRRRGRGSAVVSVIRMRLITTRGPLFSILISLPLLP